MLYVLLLIVKLMLKVTGLAVSDRHPYMFSAGLDKMVKCWDMEYNKVGCQHVHSGTCNTFVAHNKLHCIPVLLACIACSPEALFCTLLCCDVKAAIWCRITPS